MAIEREIVESPATQGVDEEIAYTLTTTPWGSSPTSPVITAWDVTDGGRTDVMSTIFPSGSPSVSGDVITLQTCKDMVANTKYRIEIKFTCSGNIFETYCFIYGEE